MRLKMLIMLPNDFIKSDIKNMFTIINLLLMGNDQHVSNEAILLFNLLKIKK